MDGAVPADVLALLLPDGEAPLTTSPGRAPSNRQTERVDLALDGLAGSSLREEAQQFVSCVCCT